jgi:hypothetical protein
MLTYKALQDAYMEGFNTCLHTRLYKMLIWRASKHAYIQGFDAYYHVFVTLYRT